MSATEINCWFINSLLCNQNNNNEMWVVKVFSKTTIAVSLRQSSSLFLVRLQPFVCCSLFTASGWGRKSHGFESQWESFVIVPATNTLDVHIFFVIIGVWIDFNRQFSEQVLKAGWSLCNETLSYLLKKSMFHKTAECWQAFYEKT